MFASAEMMSAHESDLMGLYEWRERAEKTINRYKLQSCGAELCVMPFNVAIIYVHVKFNRCWDLPS